MDEEAVASGAELEPRRVAELVDRGAQLIDTRRDYEWAGGRIAGARHIEVNRITAEAASLPRDRPIVFYCRTGNRSAMVTDAFREAGYDAYNLAGGITAWVEAGLGLEPDDGDVIDPLPAS
ncbi:MAG TPA: rhodanese-like domain-containing protein [Solirubrobacterales bacterium]|nr:rhodanese-like domain-containing protein [Solirubrobacterales bacterium]